MNLLHSIIIKCNSNVSISANFYYIYFLKSDMIRGFGDMKKGTLNVI